MMDCRRCRCFGYSILRTDMRRNPVKAIMDYFSNNYLRGLTPNPCIHRVLKFRILLKRVKLWGPLTWLQVIMQESMTHLDASC